MSSGETETITDVVGDVGRFKVRAKTEEAQDGADLELGPSVAGALVRVTVLTGTVTVRTHPVAGASG
ncbi:MAG: hypothetical protein ABEJ40_08555 [Haloarculaceae archaeon]